MLQKDYPKELNTVEEILELDRKVKEETRRMLTLNWKINSFTTKIYSIQIW